MQLILWTLKALVFFTLFAFALNNQHLASVKWFFGVEWQAPMVFVVLAAFAAGCVLGVVSMVPGRWHRRSAASRAGAQTATPGTGAGVPSLNAADGEHGAPPRDGL